MSRTRLSLVLIVMWISGAIGGYAIYGKFLEYRVIEKGIMLGTERIFGGACD